ncbi:MAG: hypothetical protein KDI75_09505 [Xanthomonadales bacterium]|nr:hypothetical protein [Xanthomonadales bacterium]
MDANDLVRDQVRVEYTSVEHQQVMKDVLPDDQWLKLTAGERSFARGVGYWHNDRIEITGNSATGIEARAFGTEEYQLWLKVDDHGWGWDCDCPAADGGAFCKHLVALVLTARGDVDQDSGESNAAHSDAALRLQRLQAAEDELRVFLQSQPAERLAGWLHSLAQRDSDVERMLQMHRAAEDPGALKAVLAKALTVRGFLDYRRIRAYAERVETVVGLLGDLLQRDPKQCMSLCEYALKRLFKVYERSDDSYGYLGGPLQDVATLYARACSATLPGKALVKPLLALQVRDDWGMLPLSSFWTALGAEGQAMYARRVVDDFDALPAPVSNTWDSVGEDVCHRAEALARCSDDFDLLQRVLRRDLSSAYAHLRVLESLRDAGREREALAWAENAVKQFPGDDRLRSALAECLDVAGMTDEALEIEWLRFQDHSTTECWDALKRRAGEAWPDWRDRAMSLVAERDRTRGTATQQADLLIHDRDISAAVELARANPIAAHVLMTLAARIKRNDPLTAGTFYLRVAKLHASSLQTGMDYRPLVETLAMASKLVPEADWRPLLSEVRETHARKSKLMGLLDKAGL